MAKRTKPGICRICLRNTDLTFEHVPPDAAFNDKPVKIVEGERTMGLPLDGEIKHGRIQQRGAGDFTLCAPCNNNTGSWYGTAFADWCVAGYNVLIHTRGRPRRIYLKEVYPLRIAKQIITMFCSVCGPRLAQTHPYITKLLLDRDAVGIPDGLRIFVHFAIGSSWRQTGMAAPIKLDTGSAVVLSELIFPPFGYLLMYDNASPTDSRLLDMTSLGFNRFDDKRTMTMNFPLLPRVSPFAGDYRTLDELEADKAEDAAIENARRQGSEAHG